MKQFNLSKGIKGIRKYQKLMMKCQEVLRDKDLQKKEEVFKFLNHVPLY